MSTPLVSIIMPLYNAAPYVGEAMGSVLAQTFSDWELIVVDDASTDESYAAACACKKDDPRIVMLSHEANRGAGAARDTALAHARGRFIAYLDADDYWYPTKLQRQLDFMGKNGCPLCFCAYETVNEQGEYWNTVAVPESLDYKGFMCNTVTCGHTMMVDTSVVDKSLLFVPPACCDEFPEDLAVWLNVLKRGVRAWGLNEVLACNRKHAGSRSANKMRAVKRTYNQYRYNEKLSLPTTAHCLFWQMAHAVRKRMR